MRLKASVYTLGCRVNQYDSLRVMRALLERGFEIVPFGEPADLVIVNSCTVTAEAERKTRKAVRQARRSSPGALVVLMGCSGEAREQGLLNFPLPEADLVVGLRGRERILEIIERSLGLPSLGPVGSLPREELKRAYSTALLARARLPLKIQEGCDFQCSYCIVRLLRGEPRSVPIEEAVEEAHRLVEEGAREIVPTGTCLSLYGRDIAGRALLPELLDRLAEVPGITIRLSSLLPADVTDELLAVIKSHWPKICPHFHLPLQSGDDEILERMRRPYRRADYEGAVDRIRAALPDAAITTDIMVGFPGETERNFRNTLSLVREAGFSRLHIFPFSPRPGTTASTLKDDVPGWEKHRRFKELKSLGEELASHFRRRFIGRRVLALAEERLPDGRLAGTTAHYLRVVFDAEPDLGEERHYLVEVEGEDGEALTGRGEPSMPP